MGRHDESVLEMDLLPFSWKLGEIIVERGKLYEVIGGGI